MIMSLQDNLKLLRMKLGYKQAKDFAKFAGIPYSSYSAYERGSWPNEENLIKLARALNVSIDTLIGYTPEKVDKFAKAVSLLKEVGYEVVEWQETPGIYIVYDTEDPIYLPIRGWEKFGYFVNKSELIEIADTITLSPEIKEGYHKAFKSSFRKNQLQQMKDEEAYYNSHPEEEEKQIEKWIKDEEAYYNSHPKEKEKHDRYLEQLENFLSKNKKNPN